MLFHDVCLSVCLSPLFPTTVLLGHLLLWSLCLPASGGALQGFLSIPYSASLSLTIYSDIPDTGKLLEYERGMLIRESQQPIWSPWLRQESGPTGGADPSAGAGHGG